MLSSLQFSCGMQGCASKVQQLFFILKAFASSSGPRPSPVVIVVYFLVVVVVVALAVVVACWLLL